MLWGLIPLMPDLQTHEPHIGLRTLIPVGEPLQYDYCLVYASPTQQEWRLVVLRIHPLYHLLMTSSVSLEVEYLFWQVPDFFAVGCSAVSCDLGVFLRGGKCRSLLLHLVLWAYFRHLFFFFFFIYCYQLEANYFTILLQFLSYIDMNQPWIYKYSPSRSPLPPPSPPDSSGSSSAPGLSTCLMHLFLNSTLQW